jgi:hypothetical protein
MGAGESDLDLDSLALKELDLQMGAGQTTVDLTGDCEQDLDASIQGGVGVKVRVEGDLGKINAEGLEREGHSYVNDANGSSDVTPEVG